MTRIIDKTIVVWFSCGAASAVAAKKTIERYGSENTIRIVNNPVAEEHEDNKRFLNDCEKWLGIKIESATNSKFPSCSIYDVFKKRKYISGIAGAPCTQELKKKARQEWESVNNFDYMVLGFTADEVKRHNRFAETERGNVLPVLIEERITKKDCFEIIKKAGIELPKIYSLGYPNANCVGCVKSTSGAYWNLVKKTFPERFDRIAKLSREIGCKLARHKGKRLFLDELTSDMTGRQRKNVECGIFCEESL